MPVKRIGDSNIWIREALKTCGYNQRDLARAWGVAEPSVSRFISGVEGHDPSLSRAMTLCSMLNITLEQLARGLALKGRRVEPAITSDVGLPPVGTFKMDMISPGLVRLVMVQDVTPMVASQMVAVLGGAGPAPAPAQPEIPGKK